MPSRSTNWVYSLCSSSSSLLRSVFPLFLLSIVIACFLSPFLFVFSFCLMPWWGSRLLRVSWGGCLGRTHWDRKGETAREETPEAWGGNGASELEGWKHVAAHRLPECSEGPARVGGLSWAWALSTQDHCGGWLCMELNHHMAGSCISFPFWCGFIFPHLLFIWLFYMSFFLELQKFCRDDLFFMLRPISQYPCSGLNSYP